jgi:hypothetical protein
MILEIERGKNRSQFVENSLWKRLWTCSKTDCGMINLASKCNFLTLFQQRTKAGNLLRIIYCG